MRGLLLAAVVLTGSGCAARSAPIDAALAHADELVRQGCYDCLLEARASYDRLRTTGTTPAVSRRLFQVNLLLALREKELALEPTDAIARARALEPALPLTAGYVEAFDAVLPDRGGTSRRRISQVAMGRLTPQSQADVLAALGRAGLDPIVDEYVTLALRCASPLTNESALQSSGGGPAAPLVAFRRAICGLRPDDKALAQLRSDNPRFVETALFEARSAFGAIVRTDGSAVRSLLDVAYARFPRSAAVTYMLGVVTQTFGDMRRAVGYYTETLDLDADHEDARLARAMCRSYLNEADGAVADATLLIDGAAYNRGEAHYWRAFNEHRSRTFDAARADIDAAKALIYNSRVLTLAGMIEHQQQDLATAATDLTRAVDLDAQNCQARWYLGVVKYAAESWLESGAAFAGAAGCYRSSAAASEQQLGIVERRDDLDAAYRARQVAALQTAVKEDRTQESAAAINAANNYARGGEDGRAREYLERAATDPARRADVEQLRKVLDAR